MKGRNFFSFIFNSNSEVYQNLSWSPMACMQTTHSSRPSFSPNFRAVTFLSCSSPNSVFLYFGFWGLLLLLRPFVIYCIRCNAVRPTTPNDEGQLWLFWNILLMDEVSLFQHSLCKLHTMSFRLFWVEQEKKSKQIKDQTWFRNC